MRVTSLTAVFKRIAKTRNKRCGAKRNQREFPVEPEHNAEHEYDGDEIDADIERRE